jgi:oligopeptidase B
MESLLAPADVSVAWHRTRFSYYTQHLTGRDYAQLMREKRKFATRLTKENEGPVALGDGNRAAELLLDFGSLVDDSGYLDLGITLVSPDENLLAYSVDTTGDEVFVLRFRDLRTGVDCSESIARTYYGGAWSADSASYFYTVHDAAYRPYQVWRHQLGSAPEDDQLVLTEPDERFEVNLRASRSGQVIMIWSESNTTSEGWVIDSRRPDARPLSIGGRRPGVRYRADHRVRQAGDDLLIVTNDGAVEFRLMTAPVPSDSDQEWTAWRQARAEHPADRLEQAHVFAGGVVLTLRTEGTHALRLLSHDDLAGPGRDLRSRFPGGELHLYRTPDYASPTVCLVDESYTEPAIWSTVDWGSGQVSDVRREEAPGHDPGRYLTQRHEFPSADGTPVPATVVRHRDTPLDGTAPALVYGYGSYEVVFEPEWDPALPSFLDRGAVFVFAHVRGGGENGRRWYLDGKLQHKQHTFDDHIAVADGLATAGLVDPDRIATRGLSAGGLLQGAVFSQRPDRWRAVVAEVPFVDVVTTMFDQSTPLTITEWEEWGDPRIRAEFDAMSAYDPIQNPPPAGVRPDLLVTGAVHDPRVMVREPAKWVATLRAGDPQWSPRCVFRCETGAGAHVGPSGRFGHLAYEAEIYAWLLDLLDLAES